MLSFSAEVFQSFLAQYNRSIWPGQIVGSLLALLAIGIVLRPRARIFRHLGNRAVGIVLAIFWLWTGVCFFYLEMSAINFAAPAIGLVFAFEGLLLLAWAVFGRANTAPNPTGAGTRSVGILLIAAGLLWPVVESLAGVPIDSIRSLGTTPLPTVLVTLGLLMLVPPRTPLWLVAIPILWTLAGGTAAYGLGLWRDLMMPAAGLAAFVAIILHRWRAASLRPG